MRVLLLLLLLLSYTALGVTPSLLVSMPAALSPFPVQGYVSCSR